MHDFPMTQMGTWMIVRPLSSSAEVLLFLSQNNYRITLTVFFFQPWGISEEWDWNVCNDERGLTACDTKDGAAFVDVT